MTVPALIQPSKALLTELALEIDNDAIIAKRHGLTVGQLTWARAEYAAEILNLALEMRDNGTSFRRKLALVVEHHIPTFAAKMADPNIGIGSFMDMFRTAAKYGELEPRPDAVQVGGSGFQINIVVNGQSVTKSAVPLTVEADEFKLPDFEALTTLDPPKFLDTADLSVNDELTTLPLQAA